MKKILLLFIILFVTGCGNLNEESVGLDKLSEINDEIIEYFSLNGLTKYDNFGYNYVDVENKVVVVALIENTKEEQDEFKKTVIDSDLIKFIEANK